MGIALRRIAVVGFIGVILDHLQTKERADIVVVDQKPPEPPITTPQQRLNTYITTKKAVPVIPKGCKYYIFDREGRFNATDHKGNSTNNAIDDVVYKTLASSDSAAKNKHRAYFKKKSIKTVL